MVFEEKKINKNNNRSSLTRLIVWKEKEIEEKNEWEYVDKGKLRGNRINGC